MAKSSKVVVTHPVTGTTKQLDADVYEIFKNAILKNLQNSRGKTFTELADAVSEYIRKKHPSFKGSAPWYTISVRLDLETRGFVETFSEKGQKLSRLRK
jgi:hypothetical protein